MTEKKNGEAIRAESTYPSIRNKVINNILLLIKLSFQSISIILQKQWKQNIKQKKLTMNMLHNPYTIDTKP